MHRVTRALITILAGGARSTQRAPGFGREPVGSAVRTRDRAVGEDSAKRSTDRLKQPAPEMP
jgi:hypothetical protein